MDVGVLVTPRVPGSHPLHKLSRPTCASASNSSPGARAVDQNTRSDNRSIPPRCVVAGRRRDKLLWVAADRHVRFRRQARADIGVCKLGLEGIVSKKLSAPYRSGPSKSWIKVKSPEAAATRVLDGTF